MDLKEKAIKAIKNSGRTQRDIAKACNINSITIWRLLSGMDIRRDLLVKICNELNLELD